MIDLKRLKAIVKERVEVGQRSLTMNANELLEILEAHIETEIKLANAESGLSSLTGQNTELCEKVAALNAKFSEIGKQEPAIRVLSGKVVDFNPNYEGSLDGDFYALPVPLAGPEFICLAADEDRIDSISLAMRKAYGLGQTYWMQADSESLSQQRKSDTTAEKFEALIDETKEKLCAPVQPSAEKTVDKLPAVAVSAFVTILNDTRSNTKYTEDEMGKAMQEAFDHALDLVEAKLSYHPIMLSTPTPPSIADVERPDSATVEPVVAQAKNANGWVEVPIFAAREFEKDNFAPVRYLYEHPPAKPQRITEQDAREILKSYFVMELGDASEFDEKFDYWLNFCDRGRTLLAKLNEQREPDYKAQLEKTWLDACEWIKNNYQSHPNIATLIDSMKEYFYVNK